jgi:hypothetical protein
MHTLLVVNFTHEGYQISVEDVEMKRRFSVQARLQADNARPTEGTSRSYLFRSDDIAFLRSVELDPPRKTKMGSLYVTSTYFLGEGVGLDQGKQLNRKRNILAALTVIYCIISKS